MITDLDRRAHRRGRQADETSKSKSQNSKKAATQPGIRGVVACKADDQANDATGRSTRPHPINHNRTVLWPCLPCEAGGRMTVPSENQIDWPTPGAFWASLPVPALLVDADGVVVEINPAAELFLNLSVRNLKGHALLERLHIDAPMEEAMARVRVNQSAVVINDVEITTGERAPVHCRIRIAPMQDHRDLLMVLISPRDIADRLGRSSAVKTAAKSAIGMAEMLAHEIKNPLAGISGAAQLLAMNLSVEDRSFRT